MGLIDVVYAIRNNDEETFQKEVNNLKNINQQSVNIYYLIILKIIGRNWCL
jgi:hypothetical protein